MVLHWWHIVDLNREIEVVTIKISPSQNAKTKASVGIV